MFSNNNTETSNTVDLEVIEEEAAFSLHGGSGWSDCPEDIDVSWGDLKGAPVGTKWLANNVSGCIRDSVEESAEVVYRSAPEEGAVVVTVLFRRWSAGNSPEAEVEEETPRLVAYRCK